MQSKDVTAYGCDYSAREFTPDDLKHYPGVRIEWLARYIGYPSNPKCISAYPNAYRRHRDAGRPVVLYHQIGYRDFEGGFASGEAQARVALADAKRLGWDGETPILACFDRRMPAFTRGGVYYRAIPLNEVREYVRGFVSVIGWGHAGFYGFEDTMKPCVEENWVRFRMQCGARSAHIPGIQAWQENNEQPRLLGTQTDRLELYIDKSELGGEDMALSNDAVAALEALAPGEEGVREAGETFALLVKIGEHVDELKRDTDFGVEGERDAGEVTGYVAQRFEKVEAGVADVAAKVDTLAAQLSAIAAKLGVE
jgi:hypothetical protein